MLKEKAVFIVNKRMGYFDVLNTFLIITAFILLCVFFGVLFIGQKNIYLKEKISLRPTELLPELKFLKKPITYYTQILERRGVFVAFMGSTLEKIRSGFLPPGTLESQSSDLQLQGIISGAQGPQAIVTNNKTNRSYYCVGGELIAGFKVQEVQPDKVILEVDGEKIELKL